MSSPLHLKHASKATKSVPPSSVRLKENDEDPKKPSKTTTMPELQTCFDETQDSNNITPCPNVLKERSQLWKRE